MRDNRASNVTATFSEDVQNVDATTFKLEQVKVSRKGVETDLAGGSYGNHR